MTEILAVFRSRSQAIDCLQRLKTLKIAASLVNTPREANIGCGLSVRFAQTAAMRVKSVIAHANYSAFYGYMTVSGR